MKEKTVADKIGKINKLLEKRDIDKAKKMCKENFDNKKFISLYIKILYLENNYKEIEELCKQNLDYIPIVSQYLTLLIKEERFEEAKELCEKNKKEENIQAQYITVLSHYKDDEGIKNIVSKYPYSLFINRAYALYLYRERKFIEVSDVCDRFIHDKGMFELKEKVLDIIKRQHNENYSASDINIVRTRVKGLIDEKKYTEAKTICNSFMNDSTIFELYLSILEKERIENPKKL